nr:FtsK/SpoIIIE domain-containing protein [Effusibacillus pohliae]
MEFVTGTAMTGLLTYTMLDGKGVSEASKIQRIATNCGLTVREGGKLRTMQLLRRTRYPWGTEYAYRLPLGLSFEDVKKKRQHIEDGLNHKSEWFDLTLNDLRQLKLRQDILEQIKKLLAGQKHRKEIALEYDGTLRIRVYNEPMPELVRFDEKTLNNCRGWTVCIGEAREGIVFHDFDKFPHMVVAGMTRYGKSVFLKNVVMTLIDRHPNDSCLTLIDLKGGLAFNRFADARQVLTVAKDAEEAHEALRAIQTEMKARQAKFLAKGYEDVKEAGQKERHFVVVDEGAELASAGENDKDIKKLKAECERIVSEIARIGGGLGYRLIFATQYPTADTLPRQVKQNCDARLCFRLPTQIASEVVLDEPGAEELPLIKGRAIYRTDRKVIVQTPLIENDFIDRTIKPHIVIKQRKEETDAKPADQTSARGGYTLIIEDA